MDILGQLSNSLLGGEGKGGPALAIVQQLLSEHGGLNGLVSKLSASGMESAVQSWIGTGQNLPVSAEQIQSALGGPAIQALAGKVGMDGGALAGMIAQQLPGLIDKLTPNGQMPSADQLTSQLGAVKGLFN